MAISDEDFEEIKRRLQADNVKIQFSVGDIEQAKTYVGKLGEPIVVEDKELFAICDGKSSQNRKYYPINKGLLPVLDDDTLDSYVKNLIENCMENTYPGFLTAEFVQENLKLTRFKLIEAFEGTGKFCLPDGRKLPEGCFVKTKFGISYAPNLEGKFLRHYDSRGVYDTIRTIGHVQYDSFASHSHSLNRNSMNFEGRLISSFRELYKSGDWASGNYAFVHDMVLGPYVSKYNFPDSTEYYGDRETRPINVACLSFYRYDW
ncbi:hypothetical protein bcCo53_001388 (plasmid) [Borrelia coriaceae]|uniref:Uncharacterized protein n=1 Tax=Borrelia coriaceae ATCC 43381 TaxID=1408429 RepID=W5SXZ2_9SPIR|nr:hypothetical protein [Borrelia coriaceae]AHH11742.1 Hypothetical protein BCO_0121401 [Borrelia coriaceae ATCC 43381]UPA17210.1 hypothetical protein bcCo53_001388 [Borrelia coriaceae]